MRVFSPLHSEVPEEYWSSEAHQTLLLQKWHLNSDHLQKVIKRWENKMVCNCSSSL